MARRSRLEINRAALDAVDGGVAEGVFDIARAILRVSEADAPDASSGHYPKSAGGGPRLAGEGLVMRGAAMTWAGRKKVNQVRTDGGSENVRKPRGSRGLVEGQINGMVGWGFPSMFLEFGTVHAPPHPFFTKAASEVVGSEAEILLSKAMQRRLRGERDPKSAGITARIQAAREAAAAKRGTP